MAALYRYNKDKTFFISSNGDYISQGSCANIIDSSYLECLAGERSEFSSRKGPVHIVSRDISPTLFLEYHCVASDYSISLNALNSVPGHHDASGGHGGSHIAWSSSGGYMEDYITACIMHIAMVIPAFGVANITSATLAILLPNKLNVVVTVTV